MVVSAAVLMTTLCPWLWWRGRRLRPWAAGA
jgi:hypothetical protein